MVVHVLKAVVEIKSLKPEALPETSIEKFRD